MKLKKCLTILLLFAAVGSASSFSDQNAGKIKTEKVGPIVKEKDDEAEKKASQKAKRSRKSTKRVGLYTAAISIG